MKKVPILCLLAVALCAFAAASDEIDTKKREAWFAKTLSGLKKFTPSEDTKEGEVRKLRIGRITYTVEDEGLIRFAEGQWLYIVTHSGHEEDGVGDAALAVDHEGNLYRNDSHVCEGILVYAMSGVRFETVQQFLEAEVVGGEKWKKIE